MAQVPKPRIMRIGRLISPRPVNKSFPKVKNAVR